jgi:hypothetical protein
MFHVVGLLEDKAVRRGRGRKLLPQRKVAVRVEALPVARFFRAVADRFLCVSYDGGVMLGIIGAAKDLRIHNKILGVRGVVRGEITLRAGITNSAGIIAAAIGRTYLGAARIVSHAPVMDGAEGLNVVTHLIRGYNVLGHNQSPRLQ